MRTLRLVFVALLPLLALPVSAAEEASGGAPAEKAPAAATAETPDAKPSGPAETKERKVIESGSRVVMEYTLKVDGEVADTNVGGEPVVFEQGNHQVLPALEEALEGMGPGDTKQISLSAEQGYGVVDPERFETVPASTVPEDARKVGTQLVTRTPEGQTIPVRVHEVKGDEIVMDFNHPLAGRALQFDIKILDVQ